MPGPAPADSSALAERDPRFPSGAWSGFFQQRTDRPTAQDMHFRGGRLTGAGADDCGRFTLSGTYDTARGVAEWSKSYGRYSVQYRGFAEDGSLWGVWTLASGVDRGGFRLWPEKQGRRGVSSRTGATRPAVVAGDVDAADAFAESLRERLEPAGKP
ncbi:hypothetical protein [Alienimonas californiensis]|uniref:Uncharacterized protein n=1 Tax=Alienimonas californiensis TaxID=2527989 RepID=A0A517PFI8_9PLAN|nr:hypothetical protein [Alienimonas californiensis]QDT18143.1 hypothetical protein CA12_42830 [Alienimonas californiensis]